MLARLTFLLALAVTIAAPRPAAAFPDKPVTLVVPYAAGGPTDVVARLIAERLTARWNQRVIVDNRPGASGVIGVNATRQAAADGHTLMLHATAGLTIYPALAKAPAYDTLADLTPIAPATYSDLVLVVHPTLPVASVADLVALAKREPGKLSYASAGIGGLNHIGGALFAMLSGITLNHVPYKGDSPAVVDLVGGNVTLSFLSANLAIPQVRSGKLKALAVTGRTRAAALPDLPTMIEAGVADFDLRAWNAVVGPAGMDAGRVREVHDAIADALADAGVRAKLAEMGLTADQGTPAELAERIRTETARWRTVVRAAGIPPQ